MLGIEPRASPHAKYVLYPWAILLALRREHSCCNNFLLEQIRIGGASFKGWVEEEGPCQEKKVKGKLVLSGVEKPRRSTVSRWKECQLCQILQMQEGQD